MQRNCEMPIRLKRAYDPPAEGDGTRVLVDRLWPRGLSRERARIDLWLRDIAPSDALRRRFHGKPDDWESFCKAYARELEEPAAKAAVAELDGLARRGVVTLLYASRDERRNNAVALEAWLDRREGGR
jgi:uncharacterized protein YeaO (DUF488 family)